jgi:hypothetical protein
MFLLLVPPVCSPLLLSMSWISFTAREQSVAARSVPRVCSDSPHQCSFELGRTLSVCRSPPDSAANLSCSTLCSSVCSSVTRGSRIIYESVPHACSFVCSCCMFLVEVTSISLPVPHLCSSRLSHLTISHTQTRIGPISVTSGDRDAVTRLGQGVGSKQTYSDSTAPSLTCQSSCRTSYHRTTAVLIAPILPLAHLDIRCSTVSLSISSI